MNINKCLLASKDIEVGSRGRREEGSSHGAAHFKGDTGNSRCWNIEQITKCYRDSAGQAASVTLLQTDGVVGGGESWKREVCPGQVIGGYRLGRWVIGKWVE